MCAGPWNTNRDIVHRTRFQGKGTCRLHEPSVARRVRLTVVACFFRPEVTGRVPSAVRRLSLGTPVTRIGISGEHEVAFRSYGTAGGAESVTTVLHLLTVLPDSFEVVVIFGSDRRVSLICVVIVMVNETAHPVTFIVHDAVSEVHPVDGRRVHPEVARERSIGAIG